MAFTVVAKFEELKAGEPQACRAGGRDLALCRVADDVYAVDGYCPHVGGPLAHGALHGRMLACPWHAWEFDCATGQLNGQGPQRLATFAVEVRDGDVWVDVPDA